MCYTGPDNKEKGKKKNGKRVQMADTEDEDSYESDSDKSSIVR